MKKTIRMVALAAIVMVTAFSMSGCAWLVEDVLNTVSGTVVDARTGGGTTAPDGVADVVVTLTNVSDGSTITDTTDSNGNFSISFGDGGQYRLTASKSGWFFVPQTVNLSGWLGSTPDVIGVQTGGSSGLSSPLDNALTFILVWNDGYEDIDSHLTYTDGDGSGDAAAAAYTIESSFGTPYATWTAGGGFGPEATNREDVSPAGTNYSATTSPISHSDNTVGAVLDSAETSVYAVQQDRDDRDGEGPEVITVNTIPLWPVADWDGNGDFGGSTTNKLPTTGPNGQTASYTWTGVMEYYIDGWDSTESDDNSRDAADSDHYLDDTAATVYVVQGSNLLGELPVPSNMNARTYDLLRINTFVVDEGSSYDYSTYFQILPNVQSVDGTVNILSLDATAWGGFGTGRSR